MSHCTFVRHSYWHRTCTAWLYSNWYRACLYWHPSTLVTRRLVLRVAEFIFRLCTNCWSKGFRLTSQWQQTCLIAGWGMDCKMKQISFRLAGSKSVTSLIRDSASKHVTSTGSGKALQVLCCYWMCSNTMGNVRSDVVCFWSVHTNDSDESDGKSVRFYALPHMNVTLSSKKLLTW
jgi:hypothetical protein